MKGHFRSVVGWEKFAGQWLLRMKLAEPQLKNVWPGSPSVTEPAGEVRRLPDEVLTIEDVVRALTDTEERRKRGYGEEDLKLLWQALSDYPPDRKPPSTNTKPRHDLPRV